MRGIGGTEGVRGTWDKYRYAVLVIAIGALVMLWPVRRPAEIRDGGAAVRDIQREMEEVVGKIGGVGRVRLMLTEESGAERILAENRATSRRGEEYSGSAEIVLADTGGRDEAVVTRTLCPTYRGALVVCEGGDRAAVRLAVTRAVSALTGLTADRIAVEKWQ